MSFYAKPRYADRVEVLYPEPSSIPGGVYGFTRHHKGVFHEDTSKIEVWTLTPESLHIPKTVAEIIINNGYGVAGTEFVKLPDMPAKSTYDVHDGLMVASLETMIVLKLYELHGSIHRMRCMDDNCATWSAQAFFPKESLIKS